ncbi:uncharacterized protein N7469_009426 [Penicillium citrinum]|uniref:RNase H type-1 domain-containing protein n=1 Tax=Penicillium citrinum TaxID=5077 RepID=A0A9W9NND7_PENCI|nr:uncharacterized protein N7469_009426 [Penicillium citrinum]KAJ5223186.1 hypothetical protein N7469_009426 [Penicillium citrinum]
MPSFTAHPKHRHYRAREGTNCYVTIFADNQAAIQAVGAPTSRRGAETRIHWVPGHLSVFGNERADEIAKQAAQSLVTLCRIHLREVVLAEWKQQWANGPNDAYVHYAEATKEIFELHNRSRRPGSSVLAQMQSGKLFWRLTLLHSPTGVSKRWLRTLIEIPFGANDATKAYKQFKTRSVYTALAPAPIASVS